MEQQRPNQTDAATLPSPGSDAQGGGIPPFNPQLLNHANPPAMAAATMARPPVLHHQTSASMPVQEANLLLPAAVANGNAPIQPQPDNKTVSAGEQPL